MHKVGRDATLVHNPRQAKPACGTPTLPICFFGLDRLRLMFDSIWPALPILASRPNSGQTPPPPDRSERDKGTHKHARRRQSRTRAQVQKRTCVLLPLHLYLRHQVPLLASYGRSPASTTLHFTRNESRHPQSMPPARLHCVAPADLVGGRWVSPA